MVVIYFMTIMDIEDVTYENYDNLKDFLFFLVQYTTNSCHYSIFQNSLLHRIFKHYCANIKESKLMSLLNNVSLLLTEVPKAHAMS